MTLTKQLFEYKTNPNKKIPDSIQHVLDKYINELELSNEDKGI